MRLVVDDTFNRIQKLILSRTVVKYIILILADMPGSAAALQAYLGDF